MTPLLRGYLLAWLLFCLVAVAVAVRDVRLRLPDVRAFLRVPWKVALFVPAIVFVTLAGRFTDDETWDLVSGGGMSVLTVATSWWSVGTAVRVWRGMERPRLLLVALAATLFSSSWFYDGWLLLRDGAYTARWLGNLLLSPTVYLAAGLVLNLETREGRLAVAFTREDWPRPVPATRSWLLVLASVPLVAVAVWILVGFVGWRLPF